MMSSISRATRHRPAQIPWRRRIPHLALHEAALALPLRPSRSESQAAPLSASDWRLRMVDRSFPSPAMKRDVWKRSLSIQNQARRASGRHHPRLRLDHMSRESPARPVRHHQPCRPLLLPTSSPCRPRQREVLDRLYLALRRFRAPQRRVRLSRCLNPNPVKHLRLSQSLPAAAPPNQWLPLHLQRTVQLRHRVSRVLPLNDSTLRLPLHALHHHLRTAHRPSQASIPLFLVARRPRTS